MFHHTGAVHKGQHSGFRGMPGCNMHLGDADLMFLNIIKTKHACDVVGTDSHFTYLWTDTIISPGAPPQTMVRLRYEDRHWAGNGGTH